MGRTRHEGEGGLRALALLVPCWLRRRLPGNLEFSVGPWVDGMLNLSPHSWFPPPFGSCAHGTTWLEPEENRRSSEHAWLRGVGGHAVASLPPTAVVGLLQGGGQDCRECHSGSQLDSKISWCYLSCPLPSLTKSRVLGIFLLFFVLNAFVHSFNKYIENLPRRDTAFSSLLS